MLSLTVLGAINALLILNPPHSLLILLDLMRISMAARVTLVVTVVVNVVLSVLFERIATNRVGRVIGSAMETFRSKTRVRSGKVYKAVESGMR